MTASLVDVGESSTAFCRSDSRRFAPPVDSFYQGMPVTLKHRPVRGSSPTWRCAAAVGSSST
ncbi:hypothetical protein [Rhodococcus gannanensis]|uniref:Uncharacterized protein n=1 Tax=Rhodococcus gannanensis TaxID=1960308 RepID=A0ABW4P3X9_9NOCA